MKKIFFIVFLIVFSASFAEEKVFKNVQIDVAKYLVSEGAKVIIISDSNSIPHKVIITGVTGYDEYGKDIVASALSVLSINTVNTFLELTNLDFEYNLKEYKKLPYLEFYINKTRNKEAELISRLLFDSFKLGVKDIEVNYGKEYVQLFEVVGQ